MTPVRRPAQWLAAAALAATCAHAWAADATPPAAEGVPAGNAGAAASAPAATAPTDGAAAAPGTESSTAVAPPVAAPVAPPAAAPVAPAPSAAPRPAPIRLDPPRASLVPLAQPLWSELTPAQQRVLEPFATQWNALPVSEKRAWAELASRFPKMKADERKRVERRITEWAELTPEQRKLARANYRLAQQIARDGVLAEWENYQAMTPEQRSVLNTAGSTSNTAARHAGASTGLAKEAAQPLPRRAPARPPVTAGTEGNTLPATGVTPTLGPAGAAPRP